MQKPYENQFVHYVWDDLAKFWLKELKNEVNKIWKMYPQRDMDRQDFCSSESHWEMYGCKKGCLFYIWWFWKYLMNRLELWIFLYEYKVAEWLVNVVREVNDESMKINEMSSEWWFSPE